MGALGPLSHIDLKAGWNRLQPRLPFRPRPSSAAGIRAGIWHSGKRNKRPLKRHVRQHAFRGCLRPITGCGDWMMIDRRSSGEVTVQKGAAKRETHGSNGCDIPRKSCRGVRAGRNSPCLHHRRGLNPRILNARCITVGDLQSGGERFISQLSCTRRSMSCIGARKGYGISLPGGASCRDTQDVKCGVASERGHGREFLTRLSGRGATPLESGQPTGQ